MIQVQELRNQLAFALDAEGSDHYLDEPDYFPAINASIKWLTNVINAALGRDKIGEEFFRDLTYTGVFKTTDLSRVSLNVFPSEVWTVISVLVDPETQAKAGVEAPTTPSERLSYFMYNLTHVSSYKSCKRLSIEEWTTTRSNPFEDGYDGDQLCDDLKQYAYLNPVSYRAYDEQSFNTDPTTITTQAGIELTIPSVNSLREPRLRPEIEIRPAVKNDLVTISWVKKPDKVTSLNDEIEFPDSVFQLLFNKALNYIAYKQGDNTTIHSVTEQDIALLLNVI
jgi:hypothetical protein